MTDQPRKRSPRRALARVEVLVSALAATALFATIVPVVGSVRRGDGEQQSASNLRVLGAGHAAYAADWNGRQLTFVNDEISQYGHTASTAFPAFAKEHGDHPGVALGWGRRTFGGSDPRWFAYRTSGNCANATLTLPIEFTGAGCNPGLRYFGSFRKHNAEQFHQYLGGRFYDPVFYAPKDARVVKSIGLCVDQPDPYCRFNDVCDAVGEIPTWSSYCLSPAAMFHPSVLARNDPDEGFHGYQNPWDLDNGFESPGLLHALYPALKTHMLEHHWLQGAKDPCNPAFDPGTYGEDECCEPYYFNHAVVSRPMTLFYDGHVSALPVGFAMFSDSLVRQEHPDWGLWSRDTPFGADGYLSQYGYDGAHTSFHVLTTDGIRGRDFLGSAIVAPPPASGAQVRRRAPGLIAAPGSAWAGMLSEAEEREEAR